jgi:hypothetical protein
MRIVHSVLMAGRRCRICRDGRTCPDSEHGSVSDDRWCASRHGDHVDRPGDHQLPDHAADAMTMPPALADALQWWSSLYSTTRRCGPPCPFAQLGGLLGGVAAPSPPTVHVAAAAERCRRPAPDSSRPSGVRIASSCRTRAAVRQWNAVARRGFRHLRRVRIFWLKMALISALLINGALLVRAGRRCRRPGPRPDWVRLRRASVASLALWFLTTLLGAALPNIG